MPLLQHFGDGDAGCAYLRKGEKRAVPRPIIPVMPPTAADDDAGGVQYLEGVIRGNFTGENAT